jgi:predicted transcriptional regulator
MRTMQKQGLSLTEICQSTGFTMQTVRNYLSEQFNPISGHYGKQREGKLEPYRQDVLRWRGEGLTFREIHARIAENGYTGTQDAIRNFISKERRIHNDLQQLHGGQPIEFVDKKWFIRLLYKPIEQCKGITEAQLIEIFKTHPKAEQILHMVNLFKDMLKSQRVNLLPTWFDEAAALGIEELITFAKGLQKDIAAVTNAFTSPHSNGLAEGTINKIKVVKRIMYGKCSFDLLKCKCLLLNEQ